MDTLKNIVIWVLFTIAILQFFSPMNYYSAIGEVVEVNHITEEVTFRTQDGFEYTENYKCEWKKGDIAAITLKNIKSDSFEDDVIVNARHERRRK